MASPSPRAQGRNMVWDGLLPDIGIQGLVRNVSKVGARPRDPDRWAGHAQPAQNATAMTQGGVFAGSLR